MAEIFAQLQTDAQSGPQVKVTPTGKTWTRIYEVNTADVEKALEARNAPRAGQSSPDMPGLVCLSVTAKFIGGVDGSDGTGGATQLTAEYGRTTGGSTGGPTPRAGLSWSEWIPEVSQVTVYGSWYAAPLYALQLGLALPNFVREPAINNGQGFPRDVTVCAMRIHRYYNPREFDSSFIHGLLRISNTINKVPITMAPLYVEDGPRLSFEPGQVRFRHHTQQMQGDLLELILECVVGYDHASYWREMNASGRFIGGVKQAFIYAPAVWPPALFS